MSHLSVTVGAHVDSGTPGDYNQWKALGNEGWGYEDLEPYFVKSEKTHSLPSSKHRGKNGMFRARIVQSPPSFLAATYHVLGPWENQQFPVSQYKAVP